MSSLNSKVNAEIRKGALLRCEWPDGRVGFADCHPWTEYGDADIETQLHGLARGHISNLMEQTIWLARKDAIIRTEQRSAFLGGAKVKNHYLVHDIKSVTERNLVDWKNSGFSTLKIKVGRDCESEAEDLIKILKVSQFLVRLDFNSSIDFSILERFMGVIAPGLRRKIEFVEDPFTYDEKSWHEATKLVPLAADFEYEGIDWHQMVKPSFQVLIIKPARMDVDKAINRCTTFGLKAVVTSSLDHPVGVVHSAVVATEIKRAHPNLLLECGCLTLKAYKPNEFTNKIVAQGPYITSTMGTGIGFDDLFNAVNWKSLDKDA